MNAERLAKGVDTGRLGLFRSVIGGQDRRLTTVFDNLLNHPDSKVIARSADHRTIAARVEVARTAGHGRWDFYCLGDGTFLIAGDSLFDRPCVGQIPSEDMVEFHLRLSGTMRLRDPSHSEPLVIEPNCLLVWRQPPDVEVQDRVEAGKRDTFVSLYCRPERLAELATKHDIRVPEPLSFAVGLCSTPTRHLLLPLDPSLTLIGHSLLNSPFVGGLRLLHAETKTTELLCEVLHFAMRSPPGPQPASAEDLRRLDVARQIVVTQHAPPPLIGEIARRIGMGETKLKRMFKLRFGSTIFDMSLDARMRHALELLRCKHMPVSRVAATVGYSHQTSFALAFKKHFGFPPRTARHERGGMNG
jgi:AraC-like DNA-binding protein